ncbi:Alpha/Beta hydrolase protein [Xylogone sp. PMI_703]|nr:Alpha/Beta hydrolase protein [Xylogone sp. PMI_703]
MYIYVPASKVANAPIVLAIHYCTGTGPNYFSATQYANLADQYGYIVVYPSSPSSGGCWDVASTASLTHNGGGDSQTIVNMAKYAAANYGGDANRIYATGSSSGAMMTNVLAGAYPDVIKAGSAYSGVADGCFYVPGATAGMATPGWNSQCANGQLIQTGAQWAAQVKSYYPGYTGSYPKMLLWHGTIDTTLYYPNLGEELKEWSTVLNAPFNHNVTNTPQSGYTQMVYGDGTQLIGYSAVNVGHTVPVHETVDLAWFGITGGGSGPSTTTAQPTTTTLRTSTTGRPTTTAAPPPSGGSIPSWGQWYDRALYPSSGWHVLISFQWRQWMDWFWNLRFWQYLHSLQRLVLAGMLT